MEKSYSEFDALRQRTCPPVYYQHATVLRCEPPHERSVKLRVAAGPLTRLPVRLRFAPR
jgi:hypothetical protein